METADILLNVDSLSRIGQYRGKTFVIKYGGSIMNNIDAQEAFIKDISQFINIGINIVIVHGAAQK